MRLNTILPLLCLLALPACGNPSDTAAFKPATKSVENGAEKSLTKPLRLASWNIEHLAERDGEGCKPRTEADYTQLRDYAARLNADVVALQEVESEAALARVFPKDKWQFVVSPRAASQTYECRGSTQFSTQQRVAFAIRKGVEFSYNPQENLTALGLNEDGLRLGLVITLTHTQPATKLLAIHAKSGCFINDYQREQDKRACKLLGRQAPVLDAWVEAQLATNTPFAILGDFNHRLLAPNNRLWQELSKVDGQPAAVVNAMSGLQSCHPKYKELIDHIVFGGPAATGFVRFSARSHNYEHTMLADHCAISAELQPVLSPAAAATQPVSSAVKWTQHSVEYALLTRALFAKAQANLMQTHTGFQKPWVVFMDVDETLLDNSQYNRARDEQGLGFSAASWASWVSAEQAGEVPGAKAFANAVLAAGGQLALITNRERTQDHHTWANLKALGFNINRQNTCILGRTAEDKHAIGKPGIANDKDLRRQQLLAGNAHACWAEDASAKAHWARPLQLVLEVGDNIQDFSQLRQATASAEALAERQGRDLLLLPNAMYGSWSH
ncbi:endonuclease/exonuclease/phosphatase family protein [Simiduia sp. 21SJ11W-1]|uniref:HAD family acid phosphatase n=1 Tax=Simiduia sp. 21SJ11W-1 TaxID=2909669 RepID=UPI0020A0DBA5|nr:HAD family acid phosphatase [Simiduia sp. 21SJ11W-1]UTA47582.1 endonuclease/exonuclease/phosphatase family protein [Simiduia sp. 21SJ11W-1]